MTRSEECTFCVIELSSNCIVDEPVSNAVDSSNVNGPGRIGFQLRAKPRDMVIDSPADGICLIPPDLIQQFLSCHDFHRPCNEQSKSCELFPCHSHGLSTAAGNKPAKIHFDVAEFQLAR